MSGKRNFEEQIAALDRLRQESPDARTQPLRKALAHRNNFVVAKADILRTAPSSEIEKRLEQIVAANPRLARVFETHRASVS